MIESHAFDDAVRVLKDARRVLVTTHVRPDGDACGTMQALAQALRAIGKDVELLLLSPVPDWYAFLFDGPVSVLPNGIAPGQIDTGPYGDCDTVLIVDTNSYVQLPGIEDWLKQSPRPVLVIDHHVTGDGLGTVELIDTTAAAAGEVVFDLLRHARWPITPAIAQALFAAIATDTGWFRFSNTDARLFRIAAELTQAGAQPDILYRRLYQNFSPQRFRLMARMLDSLELHFNNRVAVQTLLRRDFDETGATGRDTENLIDECRRIDSVEVAVLFVELGHKDGKGEAGFRCSLRSKGRVDVRAIAQASGGGGHAAASGVNLNLPLDAARKLILAAIAEQLNSSSA